MEEVWKPYPPAPDYEASTLGRVRQSPARATGRGRQPGRIFQVGLNHRGYEQVGLRIGGKPCSRRVHQIIAETFLGPRPPGLTVNHKDGNKRNNRPENLEYMTQAENNRHAVRTGLREDLIGANHFAATLTTKEVAEIRASSLPQRKVAAVYGCSQSTVWRIRRHRTRGIS